VKDGVRESIADKRQRIDDEGFEEDESDDESEDICYICHSGVN
jgi:hypothetical protein